MISLAPKMWPTSAAIETAVLRARADQLTAANEDLAQQNQVLRSQVDSLTERIHQASLQIESLTRAREASPPVVQPPQQLAGRVAPPMLQRIRAGQSPVRRPQQASPRLPSSASDPIVPRGEVYQSPLGRPRPPETPPAPPGRPAAPTLAAGGATASAPREAALDDASARFSMLELD